MTQEVPATPRSAFALADDALERSLLSGEHAGLLERYFGEAEYESLRDLAAQAHRREVRGGPRVLILPGIMGSKLGRERALFDDVLWIEPFEIAAGRLEQLTLGEGDDAIRPLGVILLAYLKLKLGLRVGGYDADFHAFDWRRDLLELGRGLAERLAREPAEEVSLVAHSMGGLVARAALAQGAGKVNRLVMLGTPNLGSFVPVQALRGIYPVVRKVAALDQLHSAEQLAEQVFSSFPGLYQMLPFAAHWQELDLYDPRSWPAVGPRPRPEPLQQAPLSQQGLAEPDARFLLIAGVNQETITALGLQDGEFVYHETLEGDGTVPLAFAQLPGVKTWYVEESHGSLPNNGKVADAVKDLLARGVTDALPEHWSPSRRGVVRALRDSQLQQPAFGGRSGDAIRESELRQLIAELAAPPSRVTPGSSDAGAGPGSYAHALSQVVVGRRRQHRLDVRLAQGSIDQVDSRAYVLGLFRDVDPSGPARALNALLEGMITDFTTRRIFAANVGEVFLLPTGRHPVRCDMLLFAGLGPFDRYNDESAQLVAENVIRTFVRTRVEEFATVLIGGGSGQGIGRSLRNLLAGFIRGLQDEDSDQRFRGVTLCEKDPQRYQTIKQELFRLASTLLFADVEVTFDELHLPPLAEPPAGLPRHLAEVWDPAYLIVRDEGDGGDVLQLRASVLTGGDKAGIVSGAVELERGRLDAQLRRIETNRFHFRGLDEFGTQLAQLVLTPDVTAVLGSMKERRLVVVHDAASSRVPWETLRLEDRFPALSAGMSRRYMADNLSVAKWLEQRRHDDQLDLLLVVNPTQDLEGAEEEGKRIAELFGTHSRVRIHEIRGPAARKAVLAEAFSSGRYDVLHYAGHAFFDAANPARSGIVCAGGERLRGEELANLGNLPSLVFFNACEAGRVRRLDDTDAPDIQARITVNVGLAEAFLRGGVANYVGTYWPVGDAPAKVFAETFYTGLLDATPIGQALLAARQAVAKLQSVDWADYIHYGDAGFVLKGID